MQKNHSIGKGFVTYPNTLKTGRDRLRVRARNYSCNQRALENERLKGEMRSRLDLRTKLSNLFFTDSSSKLLTHACELFV